MEKMYRVVLIAVAVLGAAWLLATAYKQRNNYTYSVRTVGLGSTDFVSDEVYWSASFSTRKPDLKAAYAQIKADQEVVTRFFTGKGFTPADYTFEGVRFNKVYREARVVDQANPYGRYEQVPDGYEMRQRVTFKSKKNPDLMKRIEELSNATAELIESGIELQPEALQYQYSDLADLKHSLIEAATADARDRARKMAETAGGKLGKLKNANMGVFQITGVGSTVDYSYGGVYDLYSKEKSARITVRLEYEAR